MADDSTRGRSAGGRALLAWTAILGLLALVGWLASERNARTWFLVPDQGRLVVMKGILLPFGRQEFKSADPSLAEVYAPLAPPPGKPLPEERAFGDQAQLDQALFDLLAAWAREDVASGEPARLERGLAHLRRAMQLRGISQGQRDELAALRAESGYFEARRLLEKARTELMDAAEKLRATAGSRSAHAMDAQLLLQEVAPAVDAALAASRASAAVRPRGAPASAPAPAPTPGPGGVEK